MFPILLEVASLGWCQVLSDTSARSSIATIYSARNPAYLLLRYSRLRLFCWTRIPPQPVFPMRRHGPECDSDRPHMRSHHVPVQAHASGSGTGRLPSIHECRFRNRRICLAVHAFRYCHGHYDRSQPPHVYLFPVHLCDVYGMFPCNCPTVHPLMVILLPVYLASDDNLARAHGPSVDGADRKRHHDSACRDRCKYTH